MPADWAIDYEAVERAKDTLEIELPTYFYIRKMKYWSGGCTHVPDEFDNLSYHVITIDSILDRKEASKCIWHELTHAWQCESLGQFMYDWTWHQHCRELGIETSGGRAKVYTPEYDLLPLEQEAAANEIKYNRRKLTKEN